MRIKRRAYNTEQMAFIYRLVFKTFSAKLLVGCLCVGVLLPSLQQLRAETPEEPTSLDATAEEIEDDNTEPTSSGRDSDELAKRQNTDTVEEGPIAEEIETKKPLVDQEIAKSVTTSDEQSFTIESSATTEENSEMSPDMTDNSADAATGTVNQSSDLQASTTNSSSTIESATTSSSTVATDDGATTSDQQDSSGSDESISGSSTDSDDESVGTVAGVSTSSQLETEESNPSGDIYSASTSSSSPPENKPNTSVVYSGDQRIFNGSTCRAVGDGGYYCMDSATADEAEVDLNQVVFAAPDKDGDMEIYVRTPDGLQKLTDNQVDDAAPRYDPVTERIVWHRLIGERYQIFMFDIVSGETTQLSNDRYNNMQPAISGDHVLWQAWIEDNWEIIHLELGATTTQLTNSKAHNIAPAVRGQFALWQTQRGADWQTTLYDLSTGHSEHISGRSGGSAQNPRLVLMYEEYADNGDITRFGYDLEAGEVINLAAMPAEQPELPDIPNPQPDDVALVHTTPSIKQQSSNDSESDTRSGAVAGTSADPVTSTSTTSPDTTGTTTASSTLEIPPFSGVLETITKEEIATTSPVETEPSASVIPDLVIPKASSSSSTAAASLYSRSI